MNELPNGWIETRLGSVCEVVRGITFPASAKQSEHNTSNVCCLRTSNIQREINWNDVYFVSSEFVKREDQFVQMGDILMSMANSYELVGKVSVVRDLPYKTAFGAFLSAIRPQANIEGQFLFHLLRTNGIQSDLRSGSSQTVNIANISVKTLSEIEIPLPPLNEQKRIAAKLDALLERVDACRARLERVPLLLKRFRQAVLAAATSGQLTEDWREETPILLKGDSLDSRKSASSLIIESELPFEIPSSWKWSYLGSEAKFINGDRGKNYPNRTEYVPVGIPFINTGHIRPNGSLSLETMHYLTREKFDSLRSGKVQKDDLVYCLRGATLGKTAIVDSFSEGAIASSLVIIRLKETVQSKYAYYILTSDYGKKLIQQFDNGSAQPNLGADSVKKYLVPIPSLAEQLEIVRRVETLFAYADRLEARYQQARAEVERLTPALLAKAFRGELVPQDPTDEPASLLLERLKAERVTTAAKPKQHAASLNGKR